ncbi:hypothetical protein DOTSEDRAFT_38982 [Dothistroma septosporum NZE10]|uniref:DNA2/NAM7 helicase-like C-terminal domain-containing protein n=1 Tax=Dothistroma septosporum (strain NZE10 / CBS 128990) TaxID=675120 RepID=M2YII5_DOTSN|nr:hypothetical protein DOTSEDRAFT_38982 [Dothistroma septosporum NZE10]
MSIDMNSRSGNKRKQPSDNAFAPLGSDGRGAVGDQHYENEVMANELGRKLEVKAGQKVTKLPAEYAGFERDHQRIYPDFLEIDEKHAFPLKAVHSGATMYRGTDIPNFGIGRKIAGVARNANQIMRMLIDDGQGGHITLGVAGHKYNTGVADLTVSHRPHTQRPQLIVDIVFERDSAGAPKKRVQCHIHAHSLQRSNDTVGFEMKMGDDIVPAHVPDTICDMYPDTKAARGSAEFPMFSTLITLNPRDHEPEDEGAWGNMVFMGITKDDLKALVVSAASGQPLAPAQMAVAALAAGPQHVLFLGSTDAKNKPEVNRLNEFSRAVFYATAHMGTYWYYTLAAGGRKLTDPKFPYSQVDPPRWLVKEWYIFTEDGIPVDWRPLTWEAFGQLNPVGLPDTSTFGNEHKIAVARELRKNELHLEALQKLTNSSHEVWGRFRASEHHNTYLVGITIEGPRESDFSSPEWGRNCFTDVMWEGHTIRMNSVVTDNMMGIAGKFAVCAKPLDGSAVRIPDGQILPITMRFPHDEKTFNRQLNAITILQQQQERKDGVHLPSAVLNSPRRVDQKTGWLRRHLSAKNLLHKYKNEIARHKLNKRQLAAAESCVNRGHDGAMIWGPPGTGKTFAQMAIVKALLVCGLRIMVTASSNNAVDNALHVFLTRNSLPEFDDSRVARFAGAISRQHAGTGLQNPEASEPAADDDGDEDMDVLQPAGKPYRGLWSDEMDAESEDMLNNTFEMVALSVGKGKQDLTKDWHGFHNKLQEFVKLRTAAMPTEDTTARGKKATADLKTARAAWESDVKPHREKAELFLDLQAQLNRPATVGVKHKRKEFAELNEYFGALYLQQHARLIFVTNSSAAHPLLAQNWSPDVALQDEAAQSTLGDTATMLAPYKECLRSWIQCGDHKQLRPVVTSKKANECLAAMTTSLFELKMLSMPTDAERDDGNCTMFDTQYRMHSQIAEWPSKEFYDGELKTADGVDDETELDKKVIDYLQPLADQGHWNKRRVIGLDISDASVSDRYRVRFLKDELELKSVYSEKYKDSDSTYNEMEVVATLDLAVGLLQKGVEPEEITIIAPYTGQLQRLKFCMRAWDDKEDLRLRDVIVLSTDACQGSENEIVIVNHVVNDRTNKQNLGFIHEPGKVNVQRTRPRRWIFYTGNFMDQHRSIKSGAGFITTDNVKNFRSLITSMVAEKDIMAFDAWKQVMLGENVPYRTFYKGNQHDGKLTCYTPLAPPARFQKGTALPADLDIASDGSLLDLRDEDLPVGLAGMAIQQPAAKKAKKKNPVNNGANKNRGVPTNTGRANPGSSSGW